MWCTARCAGVDISKRDAKVCVQIQGRATGAPVPGYHVTPQPTTHAA